MAPNKIFSRNNNNHIERPRVVSGGVRILMLSSDKNIFKEYAPVRDRMKDYGSICEELHIIVFTKRGYIKETIEDNVFLSPTNSFSRWWYVFDAVKIGRKIQGINLVTAQDPFETGFAGWLIARTLKAKLQIQIHTDFLSPYFTEENFFNKIRVFLAKFLLPKADGIRVVSERIGASLKTINYKLKTIPAVLPIFIDAQKIMSAKAQFDIHKKYPQFNFIILTVARLETEKNIFLALLVMKKLIAEYPNVGFVIVGDGSEIENLQFEIKNLKLRDNVIFETWQDELAPYYKTSDLYLSTSNYEGFGMSIMEAALSGCPIVATDAGIASYTLKNGSGALVCPVGDNECIGKQIRSFLRDPELRKRISRTAMAETLRSVPKDKQAYLLEYKKLWEKCL